MSESFSFGDRIWIYSGYLEYNGHSVIGHKSSALMGTWKGIYIHWLDEDTALVGFENLRKAGLPDEYNNFEMNASLISHDRDLLTSRFTRFNSYEKWRDWYYSPIRLKLAKANVDKMLAEKLAKPWGLAGKLITDYVYDGNDTRNIELYSMKKLISAHLCDQFFRDLRAAWDKI